MAFSIASIRQVDRTQQPIRLLVVGPEKIGKTSFAAGAPKPIVVGFEPGAFEHGTPTFTEEVVMPDGSTTARPKEVRTWAEFGDAMDVLIHEPHDRQTVIFDTLDWLGQIVEREACARAGIESLAKQAYGNGTAALGDVWRDVFRGFRALEKRGLNVILLAHAARVRVEEPNAEPYDRWDIKGDKRGPALAKEWVGCIAFARQRVAVVGAKNEQKKSRFIGERELIVDADNPGILAGNQYGMTGSVALDWDAFYEAYLEARSATK